MIENTKEKRQGLPPNAAEDLRAPRKRILELLN